VYRQSRYVDQIMVVGNNRPHLVALIVLNGPAVEAALAGSSTQLRSDSGFLASGAVMDLVKRDLAVLGERLARHEQVRAFTLLPVPLSMENGELTPTLKFRRDRIETRYAALIDGLYHDNGRK
jgi:long-chain acyl-CoA synthetase